MSDPRSRASDPLENGTALTRRSLLVSGAAGLGAIYGLTAPRGSAALDAWEAAAASGTVTFGSNYSDPLVKKAMQNAVTAFQKSSGVKIKVNTVDHNTFQEQINSYLQGRPDDVFTWFAGYRMQFFAQKGLASPIDDVWRTLSPQMSPALKAQATLKGHQYLVPWDYYPWGVFYRKSVFKQHGYKIPKTWDQFIALAKRMQKDGLTPLSFADKDGWPAMGTFDYINMRLNGYAFHISLMRGDQAWDSARVKAVFKTWSQLFPYYQKGANGRKWQDGADALAKKQTGMLVMGTDQVSPQFLTHGKAVYNDLDMFAFPSINPKHGHDSVEAPIDGFMLSRSPKNKDGAKQFLRFLGSATAQRAFLASNPSDLAANKRYPKGKYNALQRRAVQLIASAKHISQFMDRDTRPDFASTVMIPALQQFINNPNDINGLTKNIQRQKKAIFGH
jgi:multiple sugar transport system substrate-binding protein